MAAAGLTYKQNRIVEGGAGMFVSRTISCFLLFAGFGWVEK